MGKKWTEEQKRRVREGKEKAAKKRAEEEAKAFKESKLKEIRRSSIHVLGAPTHYYKVDERIQFGSWEKAYVVEVIDGGLIYELDLDNEKKRKERYYAFWYDVLPYRTEEEILGTSRLLEKDSLRVIFSNTSLGGVISNKHFFGCNLDPEYQRGHVWDLDDKLSLIKSIFHNIDIGKFTFVRRPYKMDDDAYEIIDGKQRLTALLEFVENRFSYEGKYWRDLHPLDRHHVRNYGVLVAELPEDTTELQKRKYFIKLNTSGKPQDPEHIAKVKKQIEKMEGE